MSVSFRTFLSGDIIRMRRLRDSNDGSRNVAFSIASSYAIFDDEWNRSKMRREYYSCFAHGDNADYVLSLRNGDHCVIEARTTITTRTIPDTEIMQPLVEMYVLSIEQSMPSLRKPALKHDVNISYLTASPMYVPKAMFTRDSHGHTQRYAVFAALFDRWVHDDMTGRSQSIPSIIDCVCYGDDAELVSEQVNTGAVLMMQGHIQSSKRTVTAYDGSVREYGVPLLSVDGIDVISNPEARWYAPQWRNATDRKV